MPRISPRIIPISNRQAKTGYGNGRGGHPRPRVAPENLVVRRRQDSDILCGKGRWLQNDPCATGYGRQYRTCGADFIARDIVEAAQIILGETK